MRKCVCMIQRAGPARRLSSGSKSFVWLWVIFVVSGAMLIRFYVLIQRIIVLTGYLQIVCINSKQFEI